MITGTVNTNIEAIVSLSVQKVGEGTHGVDTPNQIEAVIDTGFSGYLTLPSHLIAQWGLLWLYEEEGLLADGSIKVFDVYEATVIWNGQPRVIEVEAVGAQCLMGMGLLEGHQLKIDVTAGGAVSILPFSAEGW
jgi:clan AA aspartic protease